MAQDEDAADGLDAHAMHSGTGAADDGPDVPDRMDLHTFRASRSRKTSRLLKEDHRDLKRFFALDSAAYRDATAQGGLDGKTKELLGLVASTVLRCNDCIAYHCDQCVQVGWRKSELLDALNVALVVGGSITIPHIRTVWEVVEQLYDEQEAEAKAKEGHPALQAAAREVGREVEEQDSEAKIMLGLPPEAKGRKARRARTEAAGEGAGPAAKGPAKAEPRAEWKGTRGMKAEAAAGPKGEPKDDPKAEANAGVTEPKTEAREPKPGANADVPSVKAQGKTSKRSQGI